MILGGLDLATKSGLAVCRNGAITASTFRASAKRPFGLKPSEVDFGHEGRVAREFRDHLRAWFITEGIEAVAIEKPLAPNISVNKPIIDNQASFGGQAVKYLKTGGTNFGTIYRIYVLSGHAVELCERLGIELHVVAQQTWRSAFLGVTRAPRGTANGTAWLKNKAKETCEREGIAIANADEADAVGIVHWLKAYLNPRIASVRDDLFKTKAKS